jgi:hypothetical protein
MTYNLIVDVYSTATKALIIDEQGRIVTVDWNEDELIPSSKIPIVR